MELWLCYQNTDVRMVTRYLPGQGYPHDERGWPKWERAIAELAIDARFDRDKKSTIE